MTGTLPQKIQSLLKSLKKSQLIGLSFEPTSLGVRLEFTFRPEGHDVVMQLFQLVHFVISKEPDDNEGCFYVGEVALNPIEDGGIKLLSSLRYLFLKQDGSVASYPSRPMFHFHLEGAVCIEAVCGAYQIFEEIRDSA